MDKEQFIITLQVALLSFDGTKEEEIIKLKPDYYNIQCVKAGIALSNYLKSVEVNKK